MKLPDLINRSLWGASAILFVLTAVAAFAHSSGAWPLCVAGIACMVFANLDRISAISASTSGINIALNKAEVSIAQLTRLIRMSATLQLATVQRSGRWGGFTAPEKEKFLEESVSLLRDAGVSDTEIRDLRYFPWDRFVLFDYVHAITGGSRIPNLHDDKEIREAWESLREIDTLPSGGRLREFLRHYGALTNERDELINDYEYYLEHRSHRRPNYAELMKEKLQGLELTKPA
jgi:hypothetical protein